MSELHDLQSLQALYQLTSAIAKMNKTLLRMETTLMDVNKNLRGPDDTGLKVVTQESHS